MKKNLFFIIIYTFILCFFDSCYEPSPLYGSWADNNGSKISFSSDGTFTASIVDIELHTSTTYSGEYQVLMNTLVFKTDTSTRVTEWDIRGNMLYFTWTQETEQFAMTLYKIAN